MAGKKQKKGRLTKQGIRSYLYKNFKTRYKFKNYADTLGEVDHIIEELKEEKLRVTKKNISKIVNKRKPQLKKQKEQQPQIPEKFYQPQIFFNIDALRELIEYAPNNLVFKSKTILPKGVHIRGGSIFNYDITFKNWVSLCGNLQYVEFPGSSDIPELYWKVQKDPEGFKKSKGFYYARLVSCNRDGVDTEYSKGDDGKLVAKRLSDEEKQKQKEQETQAEPVKPVEPAPSTKTPEIPEAEYRHREKIKEIEVKAKTEQLQMLRQELRNDLKEGLITKEEYFRELEKLKP
jgi:hypothetical protein